MAIDKTLLRIYTEEGYSVELPYSVHGIMYEDFIDHFRVNEMKWNAAIEDNTKTPYDNEYANAIDMGEKSRLEKLILSYELTPEQKEGISNAQHYLISAIASIVSGDVDKLPFYSAYKLEKGFWYDPESDDEMDLSIQGLYAHVVSLMEGYVPPSSSGKWLELFNINGTGYYFGEQSITEIANTGFEVGEFVVAMELRNDANDFSQKYDGNMDFTLSLRELAVLARRKDEKLPLDDRQRTLWIDERVALFKEAKLTFGEVLKVKFFFLHFGRESMIQELIGYSLNPRSSTRKVSRIEKTQPLLS